MKKNTLRMAVLASFAVLPASATWIELANTNCICSDFSQLANSTGSNMRWVNDYGTVNINGTGNVSYASGASQLVGWFANVGSNVANGGGGQIIDTSSPYNSTVTTAAGNSHSISVSSGSSTVSGLAVARGGSIAPTDEALGMTANDSTGNIAVGVAYRNTSGRTVNTLMVSYRGEQWRNSGAGAQSIEVSYAVFPSNLNVTLGLSMDANTAPGSATSANGSVLWQSAGALATFTTPVSGGTAGALDGNAAANSQTLNFNLSNLNLTDDGFVVLRWRDVNNPGAQDHFIAIDDVCIAIPEPSTYAAIIALGAIGTSVWRSRRRATKA